MSASDHGKVSTYNNYGCRCPECKSANAKYQRERRARLSPEQKRYEKLLRIRRQQYNGRNV